MFKNYGARLQPTKMSLTILRLKPRFRREFNCTGAPNQFERWLTPRQLIGR